MRKCDITIRHYDGQARPAVNIKIDQGGREVDYAIDQAVADPTFGPIDDGRGGPAFSAAWIRANLSTDDQDRAWNEACSGGIEDLAEQAREIFGPSARIYTAGRSGGWIYVDGYTADSVAGWDAIAVSKWARWARLCRSVTDDTPARYAWIAYQAHFEPLRDANRARARFMGAAVASLTDAGIDLAPTAPTGGIATQPGGSLADTDRGDRDGRTLRPGIVLGQILAELYGRGPDAQISGADFLEFVTHVTDRAGYGPHYTPATLARLAAE